MVCVLQGQRLEPDKVFKSLVESMTSSLGNIYKLYIYMTGPHLEKTCLLPYVNNKGADQSAFVVHLLDSIINPNFQDYLVFAAEPACLNIIWSQIPEDRFSRDMTHV